MKITLTPKTKPQSKTLKNLPSGTVFGLYKELDIRQEDRNYYITITRNGHREYCNLADGSTVPFNSDCPVVVMDCALAIYGIKD